MMAGSFDSSEQEATDSSYFNISLHMYEIWPEQSKYLRWIYVEQALASMQEAPYRQRVYKLKKKLEIINTFPAYIHYPMQKQ